MTTLRHSRQQNILEAKIEEMKLGNENALGERGRSGAVDLKEESPSIKALSPTDTRMKSASQSPLKKDSCMQSSTPSLHKHEEVVGGEITVKIEPGQPPKLARSTYQKIVAGPPPLFTAAPDTTEEAQGHFEMIPACIYSNKYIGSTEHGSMDCDCSEEWGKTENTFYTLRSIGLHTESNI